MPGVTTCPGHCLTRLPPSCLDESIYSPLFDWRSAFLSRGSPFTGNDWWSSWQTHKHEVMHRHDCGTSQRLGELADKHARRWILKAAPSPTAFLLTIIPHQLTLPGCLCLASDSRSGGYMRGILCISTLAIPHLLSFSPLRLHPVLSSLGQLGLCLRWWPSSTTDHKTGLFDP